MIYVIWSIFLIFSSCAIAPFATDHSAAPLGKDNKAIDLGLSPAPYFQFAYGVNDDIDFGAGLELQLGYSLYAYGKYNLYTQRAKGFSLGLLGGAGLGRSVINTQFFFAGPIGSYRNNKFEVFVHPRYNYLRYDSFRVSGGNAATDGFDIDGGSFYYWQLAGGVQYYFQPTFALGITGVMMPPAPGEPVYGAPGISFLFRF